MKISTRGINTPSSPIRKLAPLAAAAKKRGTKVYHLNIGQPDIKSPPEFFTGLKNFSEEVVAYEAAKGSEMLCRNWSAYMNRTVGVQTKPEQFLITCGASEALLYALMGICDPGDEILVFDPTYANYIGLAVSAGIKLNAYAAKLEENFALPSKSELEKALTPKTRAILVCNPNNPTGTIYSTEELKTLLEICEERDLFLIADEAYREFVYDGAKLSSALNIAPDNQRIVIIDSLSKRFSLCGARLGCLITAHQPLFDAAHRMAQARLAAPSPEQFAASYMLERVPDNFLDAVRTEYQKRRDTLFEALKQIPGAIVHKPQGAFYTVCALPVRSGEEFASFMLEKFSHQGATTFVAPAAGFYITPNRGQNEVRIAYVLNCNDIKAAVDCLARGIEAF